MPKKIQSALLFILAGIMCFAAAVRCSSFRWAGFGRRSGILINEQWVGHRTEADHEAEGISKLDVTNVLTPVHIIRNKKSRVRRRVRPLVVWSLYSTAVFLKAQAVFAFLRKKIKFKLSYFYRSFCFSIHASRSAFVTKRPSSVL